MSQHLNISTPNSAGFEQLPAKQQQNNTLFPPESILEKCERITPLGDFEEVYERYWTQLTSS